MASIRSVALSALRANVGRQTRTVVTRQLWTGSGISQPVQRSIRPAFVPRRWHSAPSSRSKVYDFAQVKELSGSPSPERVLIGENFACKDPRKLY